MNIEEIEQLRKKAALMTILGVIIAILVGAGLFLLVIGIGMDLIQASGVSIIAGIVIAWLISHIHKKKFTEAFKEKYVLSEFNKRFENVKYNADTGIPGEVIAETRMINMGTDFEANDFLAAEYKGVKFVQSDVQIKEKSYIEINDIPVRVRNRKIFQGRWLIFDFNKSFKADIQVRQKRFANARVEKIKDANASFKKVEMENMEFNEEFKVFAQSEHDAFYILTPRMMERIQKLTRDVDGKLLFCFIDNKLHIAFNNNKDSFEHSVFKKINEQKVEDEVFRDTTVIMNFIDELNLDNDLFRKEV